VCSIYIYINWTEEILLSSTEEYYKKSSCIFLSLREIKGTQIFIGKRKLRLLMSHVPIDDGKANI